MLFPFGSAHGLLIPRTRGPQAETGNVAHPGEVASLGGGCSLGVLMAASVGRCGWVVGGRESPQGRIFNNGRARALTRERMQPPGLLAPVKTQL